MPKRGDGDATMPGPATPFGGAALGLTDLGHVGHGVAAVKIRSVAFNPLRRGLLAAQLPPFCLGNASAIAFNLAQLLDHTGSVRILLIAKFYPDPKALAVALTPDHAAAAQVVFGDVRNAVVHECADWERLGNIAAQTSGTDIATVAGMACPFIDDADINWYFTGVANEVAHCVSPLYRCRNPPPPPFTRWGRASAGALTVQVRGSPSVGHSRGLCHYS